MRFWRRNREQELRAELEELKLQFRIYRYKHGDFSPEMQGEIRNLYGSGMTQRRIAEHYGITRSQVRKVLNDGNGSD